MTTANLPLVIVEWNDAWTNEMGVTVEDVRASHKPMVVHTIGWLLLDDEIGVSLANEHFDDGSYRGRTFILRSMVVKVEPVRLVKPRKRRESGKTHTGGIPGVVL